MRKVSFERGVVKGTKGGLPAVFISHPAEIIMLTLKGSGISLTLFLFLLKN